MRPDPAQPGAELRQWARPRDSAALADHLKRAAAIGEGAAMSHHRVRQSPNFATVRRSAQWKPKNTTALKIHGDRYHLGGELSIFFSDKNSLYFCAQSPISLTCKAPQCSKSCGILAARTEHCS